MVILPKDIRKELLMARTLNPIARSTCDGSRLSELHAEPNEKQNWLLDLSKLTAFVSGN